MKKIYSKGDLKVIVETIIEKNYDLNYASVIASDFVLEENTRVSFTEDFADYSLLMDYFLNAITSEPNPDNFRRILNDLRTALEKENEIDKEHLVYILYKPAIKRLEELYKNRRITYTVFMRQIKKLGDGDFNCDKMIEQYIGLN